MGRHVDGGRPGASQVQAGFDGCGQTLTIQNNAVRAEVSKRLRVSGPFDTSGRTVIIFIFCPVFSTRPFGDF